MTELSTKILAYLYSNMGAPISSRNVINAMGESGRTVAATASHMNREDLIIYAKDDTEGYTMELTERGAVMAEELGATTFAGPICNPRKANASRSGVTIDGTVYPCAPFKAGRPKKPETMVREAWSLGKKNFDIIQEVMCRHDNVSPDGVRELIKRASADPETHRARERALAALGRGQTMEEIAASRADEAQRAAEAAADARTRAIPAAPAITDEATAPRYTLGRGAPNDDPRKMLARMLEHGWPVDAAVSGIEEYTRRKHWKNASYHALTHDQIVSMANDIYGGGTGGAHALDERKRWDVEQSVKALRLIAEQWYNNRYSAAMTAFGFFTGETRANLNLFDAMHRYAEAIEQYLSTGGRGLSAAQRAEYLTRKYYLGYVDVGGLLHVDGPFVYNGTNLTGATSGASVVPAFSTWSPREQTNALAVAHRYNVDELGIQEYTPAVSSVPAPVNVPARVTAPVPVPVLPRMLDIDFSNFPAYSGIDTDEHGKPVAQNYNWLQAVRFWRDCIGQQLEAKLRAHLLDARLEGFIRTIVFAAKAELGFDYALKGADDLESFADQLTSPEFRGSETDLAIGDAAFVSELSAALTYLATIIEQTRVVTNKDYTDAMDAYYDSPAGAADIEASYARMGKTVPQDRLAELEHARRSPHAPVKTAHLVYGDNFEVPCPSMRKTSISEAPIMLETEDAALVRQYNLMGADHNKIARTLWDMHFDAERLADIYLAAHPEEGPGDTPTNRFQTIRSGAVDSFDDLLSDLRYELGNASVLSTTEAKDFGRALHKFYYGTTNFREAGLLRRSDLSAEDREKIYDYLDQKFGYDGDPMDELNRPDVEELQAIMDRCGDYKYPENELEKLWNKFARNQEMVENIVYSLVQSTGLSQRTVEDGINRIGEQLIALGDPGLSKSGSEYVTRLDELETFPVGDSVGVDEDADDEEISSVIQEALIEIENSIQYTGSLALDWNTPVEYRYALSRQLTSDQFEALAPFWIRNETHAAFPFGMIVLNRELKSSEVQSAKVYVFKPLDAVARALAPLFDYPEQSLELLNDDVAAFATNLEWELKGKLPLVWPDLSDDNRGTMRKLANAIKPYLQARVQHVSIPSAPANIGAPTHVWVEPDAPAVPRVHAQMGMSDECRKLGDRSTRGRKPSPQDLAQKLFDAGCEQEWAIQALVNRLGLSVAVATQHVNAIWAGVDVAQVAPPGETEVLQLIRENDLREASIDRIAAVCLPLGYTVEQMLEVYRNSHKRPYTDVALKRFKEIVSGADDPGVVTGADGSTFPASTGLPGISPEQARRVELTAQAQVTTDTQTGDVLVRPNQDELNRRYGAVPRGRRPDPTQYVVKLYEGANGEPISDVAEILLRLYWRIPEITDEIAAEAIAAVFGAGVASVEPETATETADTLADGEMQVSEIVGEDTQLLRARGVVVNGNWSIEGDFKDDSGELTNGFELISLVTFSWPLIAVMRVGKNEHYCGVSDRVSHAVSGTGKRHKVVRFVAVDWPGMPGAQESVSEPEPAADGGIFPHIVPGTRVTRQTANYPRTFGVVTRREVTTGRGNFGRGNFGRLPVYLWVKWDADRNHAADDAAVQADAQSFGSGITGGTPHMMVEAAYHAQHAAQIAASVGPEAAQEYLADVADYQPGDHVPVTVVVQARVPGDLWYEAEKYGNVGGIDNNYQIETDVGRLRHLRQDTHFVILSINGADTADTVDVVATQPVEQVSVVVTRPSAEKLKEMFGPGLRGPKPDVLDFVKKLYQGYRDIPAIEDAATALLRVYWRIPEVTEAEAAAAVASVYGFNAETNVAPQAAPVVAVPAARVSGDLTENEFKYLSAIVNSEFQDNSSVVNNGVWTFSVVDRLGWPKRTSSGVASSLVQKGYIKSWPDNDGPNTATTQITQAGYNAYLTAGGPERGTTLVATPVTTPVVMPASNDDLSTLITRYIAWLNESARKHAEQSRLEAEPHLPQQTRDYYARGGQPVPPATFAAEYGQHYIRIVVTMPADQRSVHRFVDIETGRILKGASWKAPAKTWYGELITEPSTWKPYMAFIGNAWSVNDLVDPAPLRGAAAITAGAEQVETGMTEAAALDIVTRMEAGEEIERSLAEAALEYFIALNEQTPDERAENRRRRS